MRRLVDLSCALLGLILMGPILLLAALAIGLTSPGPILFRARRVGVGGRPFLMYKLRTMHLDHGELRSRVTIASDPRVFPVGRVLRRLKIDELPQLVNVLRGEMSIVGPRPEDPDFVAQCYSPTYRQVLAVRPGMVSPGSLYHDTHGDAFLASGDPEARYLERLLYIKLALDLVYVRRASLRYDCAIVLRAFGIIAGHLFGRHHFPDPPELAAVRGLTKQPTLERGLAGLLSS